MEEQVVESVVNEVEAPESVADITGDEGAVVSEPKSLKERINELAAKSAEAPEAVKEEPVLVKEEPAYAPNYKVIAYDKEYEIPELFRGVMNKDTEKQVRDVFERAYALDEMKPRYQKYKSDFEGVNKEYGTIKDSLGQLSKYVQNGDYDSFFKAIEIPETALQNWMLKKLQVRDLPPEQQQVYNQYQAKLQREYQLESEVNKLKADHQALVSQQQAQSMNQRSYELDSAIGSPEVNEIAKAFDAREGKPGAFRKEVIERAAFISQARGIDLSAQDAVKEVVRLLTFSQASQPGQAQAIPAKVEAKPTLPNVTGRSTSPTMKKIQSTDDLRKLYKSMGAGSSFEQ